jgi:hypothetical protein
MVHLVLPDKPVLLVLLEVLGLLDKPVLLDQAGLRDKLVLLVLPEVLDPLAKPVLQAPLERREQPKHFPMF